MKNTQRTIEYKRDDYGFWKQVNPQPFDYTLEYTAKQSTNTAMSWLRLGWLIAHLGYDAVRSFNVVDIGAGNGSFVRHAKKVMQRVVPFDVVGKSIPEEELYGTKWDLVVLSDVLEHYQDIDAFWKLNFKYAMVSFPEAPDVDLARWRHYKPDEHIYCLQIKPFVSWVSKHGHCILAEGNPEDAIRTRWDFAKDNISTMLISNNLEGGLPHNGRHL